MKYSILTTVLCLVFLLMAVVSADIPQLINYQGYLTDDQGDPVVDGDYSIVFLIYDAPTGETILWSSDRVTVSVQNGLFSQQLGAIPTTVFSESSTRYLGINVEGEDIGPRTQLIAVPYSFYSSKADTAMYAFSGWVDDGDVVRLETSDDSVGIGTATPTEKLDVNGNLNVSGKTTIGSDNTNSTTHGLVAGQFNVASAEGSAVLGGRHNTASGAYSVVAGGGYGESSLANEASGEASTISGGRSNEATNTGATVGGGEYNDATGGGSYVGGGMGNIASGLMATASGGNNNVASGNMSTIAGGIYNNADGALSFIAGGYCTASGVYSFALGHNATASHDGSFVWNCDNGSSASSERDNQFTIAADGGVNFELNNNAQFDFRYRLTDPPDTNQVLKCSNGALLTTGGAWTDASDRNLKENFSELNRQELLDKIASLPITRWNYKVEPSEITHISPVAQDFHATFGVGDELGIASLDGAGIALAAIQELHKKNTELEAEVAELRALVEKLLEEK